MMESSWGRQPSAKISLKAMMTAFGAIATTSFGAIMMATNPSQAAYETYATSQVVTLLNHEVCADAPKSFGVQNDCKALVNAHQSQIRQLIAENTQQRDFVFFSVYTTDVSVAAFLPEYRVETVGAFRQFHIYETTTR